MPEVRDNVGREVAAVHDSSGAKPPGGRMRKYQQLALTVIAAVSLVAFLFYKHEYERLRYTLQYLDTFGQPPDPGEIDRLQCGSNAHHPLTSPPADWVQVSNDLQVYSAFWDDQSGMGEPCVRVLGVVRASTKPPQSLTCLLWFETEAEAVVGTCSLEVARERHHSHTTANHNITVLFLLCTADDSRLMLSQMPHQLQLRVGEGAASHPLFVHQAYSVKTLTDKTTVCVSPPPAPMATLKVVEFMAHHHGIGVNRFVLYGGVLPPLARRLLDQYGDQLGLQYEEKMFSPVAGFPLIPDVARVVVELDCVWRHRDSQENVVVLGLDQYLLLPHHPTLQAALASLGATHRPAQDLLQFHLTSQRVCLDQEHGLGQGAALMLAHPIHTAGPAEEAGVAVLRPHLMAASTLSRSSQSGPATSQHISGGTIMVYHFVMCLTETPKDTHQDTQHLPSNKRFVEKIEKSLLYRKWLINS